MSWIEVILTRSDEYSQPDALRMPAVSDVVVSDLPSEWVVSLTGLAPDRTPGRSPGQRPAARLLRPVPAAREPAGARPHFTTRHCLVSRLPSYSKR